VMPDALKLPDPAVVDLLDEVIQLAGLGFFEHDHAADKIHFSAGLRRHYGWGHDQPIELATAIAQVHEDDRERLGAAIARAHDPTGDGRYDVVHRIRRYTDGELRWLAVRAQTYFADGRPVRTFGVVLDVTARQFFASPDSDQSTAARLWDILDRSLNEIYVFDAVTLHYQYVNAGALKNLGYSAQALGTMTPLDLDPTATEAGFRALVAPLLDGSQAQLAFETTLRRADGTTYPAEVRLQVIESDAARVFLAMINDITVRREAERARRLAEAAMATALHPMAISRPDGTIEWVNAALVRQWGYDDPSQLVGRPRGTLARRDQAEVAVAELLRDGTWEGEMTAIRRDGTTFPVECAISLIRDDAGAVTHVAGSFIDVTERRRAEAAMRASLEEKEALLKEVHHRVKNNLQVVTSLLALQAQRERRPEVLTALRDTQGRVRAMALLHETLYRSTNLARVALSPYLSAIGAQLSRAFLSDAAPTLTFRVDDVELALDQAMPCGLLVSELVTNALKHAFVGRSGGAIEVAAVRDGAAVTLSVTDDGAGLPPEVDPTTGATLGLRLVRALTDQLGGRLTIDRDRGTRVAITFDPAGDVPE
jgi:PAS domain S-box-containing protein